MGSVRPRSVVRVSCVFLVVVAAAWLAVVTPALAYRGWNHATAIGKRSCAVGCHAGQPPTNATCTTCHTGFATAGGQWCWECHEPGADTSGWQTAAGCTATCHLWTSETDLPDYSTAHAHAATVHLGASGYGKTCTDCHGVSLGAAAPGSGPHHDAASAEAPSCLDCHDGAIASAPSGHEVFGTDCAACHTGMDRPSGDCSACHEGRPGTTIPQITYTGALACADAGCHGAVPVHSGTPVSEAPCTTCHTAHYEDLGSCASCHTDVEGYHHGTAGATPLADCAGCHDGSVAAAQQSHAGVSCGVCHAGMDVPSMPAVCSRCHFARKFGTAVCTGCHSSAGLSGREQVHAETPGTGDTCTACHTAHYADLGACDSCHGLVPEAHHGAAAVAGVTLTLGADPARVTSGRAVVVSGALTGAGGAVAGAQVLLQERRLGAGSFADVATLVTGADGGFSRQVQPVAGIEYRAVYRGAWSGVSLTAQRPAVTPAVVRVAQSVKVTARPGVVRPRARVRVTGVVAPTAQQLGGSRPVVTLRFERRSGSRWVKVAAARVTPAPGGTYSWSWRPAKAGAYRVRAAVAATTELLGASATARVRVR